MWKRIQFKGPLAKSILESLHLEVIEGQGLNLHNLETRFRNSGLYDVRMRHSNARFLMKTQFN